ncbi:cytochrome P450 [Mycena vulgaris]|nr:cytochrome P450 [Mycena vulgaris]
MPWNTACPNSGRADDVAKSRSVDAWSLRLQCGVAHFFVLMSRQAPQSMTNFPRSTWSAKEPPDGYKQPAIQQHLPNGSHHHRYLWPISRCVRAENLSALLFCFGQYFRPAKTVTNYGLEMWLSVGNLSRIHDPDDSACQKELEENYAQVVKVHGLLGVTTDSIQPSLRLIYVVQERTLFVFDPTALHSILVKNQDVYEETPMIIWHVQLNRLFFGPAIFSALGNEHRRYRKIMAPAFSTASLRGLIPLFYEVAQQTRDGLITPTVSQRPQTIDLNSILYRTSLELIGRAGIGYSFDSMLLRQGHADRYAQALGAMFPTAFKMQLGIPLHLLAVKIFPPSFLRGNHRFHSTACPA